MSRVSPSLPPPREPGLRRVVALTLPQMGLMLCHVAITMTDLWTAGRIDASVQASLGVVAQVYGILMLVTSIAGGGCLAAVSQALGAGLAGRARRYVGLLLLLCGLTGALVALAGLACLPLILHLLDGSPELRPVVRTFVVAYCLNLPFYYTLIILNSVFRAYTLVRLPLQALALTAGANVLGSLGFGLGWWGLPDCGYAGVAWATFASSLFGLTHNIVAAARHGILRRDSLAPLRWNRRALPYLVKVGSPVALGQLARQTGGLVVLALLAGLPGDTVTVVAGMTLGLRLGTLALFPTAAVSLSIAILSGHLLGAGQYEALRRFGRNASTRATLTLAGLAGLLFLLRHPAAALMTTQPEVADCAALYLTFACAALPFEVCSGMLGGVFAGTGATLRPCLAGCASMWLLRVPLAWWLGHRLGWGAAGVYAAMTLSTTAQTAYDMAFFRSGKWLECGQRKRHTQKAVPAV